MELSTIQHNTNFGSWHKYAQDRMTLYLSRKGLAKPLGFDKLVDRIGATSPNHIVEFEGIYDIPLLIAKPIRSLQGKAKTLTESSNNLGSCLKRMQKSLDKENLRLSQGIEPQPSIFPKAQNTIIKMFQVAKEKCQKLSDYIKRNFAEVVEDISKPKAISSVDEIPATGKIPPKKPIIIPEAKEPVKLPEGKLMSGEPPITIFDKFPVSQR